MKSVRFDDIYNGKEAEVGHGGGVSIYMYIYVYIYIYPISFQQKLVLSNRSSHVFISGKRSASIAPNFLKGHSSENLVLSSRACLLSVFAKHIPET